jgi:hypothetical protein
MASNGLWALPSLSRLSAKPHSSPSRFGDYARVTGKPEVIRFEKDSLHLNVETLRGPGVVL